MSYNTVTVAATATKILSVNSARTSYIIQNVGTENLYIGQDASITTANAIKLVPDGSITEDGSSSGKLWMGDVYGIVAVGTSDARYWERQR